jgi:hypothetical protein
VGQQRGNELGAGDELALEVEVLERETLQCLRCSCSPVLRQGARNAVCLCCCACCACCIRWYEVHGNAAPSLSGNSPLS